MPTIKGPITIKPNSDNKEFVKKLEKAGVKIKLPFKATNWKSEKFPVNPEVLDGIELAGYENVKEYERGKTKVRKYKRSKYGSKKGGKR